MRSWQKLAPPDRNRRSRRNDAGKSCPYYIIIRGGSAGRERLRILSRVMRDATRLVDRVGAVLAGLISMSAAAAVMSPVNWPRRAGPSGRVVGGTSTK